MSRRYFQVRKRLIEQRRAWLQECLLSTNGCVIYDSGTAPARWFEELKRLLAEEAEAAQ